ncbi:MAG: 50S ribosomal protein L25/general stress protein Ctc [Acidobacteria bacterium]|nr:50S ribosomal protein L25/general stress protein Ctc [Acidobacteriota bacterium]
MEQLVVEAEARENTGKGVARKLRRAGRVPAVAYGGTGEPWSLSAERRTVERILHSGAGQNAVFTLKIKGKGAVPAMIRDTQLDPVKGSLLHVDFLRVALDIRLKVRVPVEVKGEPIGVKQQGGLLEIVQRDVEVECLPGDIPEHFTVDVSELSINDGIRVGDLKVDNRKIKVLTDATRVIAHVLPPRAEEEEKPAEVAVVGAEAPPAEPELIRKPRAEEGEEGEEPAAKAPEGEGKKK